MAKENSSSESKSIEELKKELSEMHKQFDSINIEKTLSTNETIKTPKSTSIVQKKVILKKVETQEDTKIIENIKSVQKEIIQISKPKVLEPIKDDVKLHKVTKESYLTIKEKLEKIKMDIAEKENSNTNSEVIEKKVIPKKTTTEKKPIEKPIEKSKNNENKEITALNNKSKKILKQKNNTNKTQTIVILILVIVILTSIFYFFFK